MTVIDNMLLGRHNHYRGGSFSRSGVNRLFERGRRSLSTAAKVEEIVDFLEMEQMAQALCVKCFPLEFRKRVELGSCALLRKPKVLLLDEPMAGMNLEETEDMARFIIDIHEELDVTTLVMIEHDMDVVMDISTASVRA
jgi:branched-chain amino acid transport system ATP-binding protein